MKRLYANTKRPQTLLTRLRKAIEDEQIAAWWTDDHGNFFLSSISGADWTHEGLLFTYVVPGRALVAEFAPSDPDSESSEDVIHRAKALFLGEFGSMLITHFEGLVRSISIR